MTPKQFELHLQSGYQPPRRPTRVSSNQIPREIVQGAAIIALGDVRDHFQTGTGPMGIPWAPIKFRIRPSPNGMKPLLDTGQLRAAQSYRLTEDGFVVGSNKIQAHLMAKGGTIRPVKGKFLAIPLTLDALRVRSAREFPRKLTCRINKAGTGGVLLETVWKKGTSTDIVHYALTKSVTIPPREFLFISDQAEKKMSRFVGNALIELYQGQQVGG
jgi:phage gpG-like protein